jgi:hypothetical protein
MPNQAVIETTATESRPRNGFDRQFVDGAWRKGHGSHTVQDVIPYTGETIAEILPADQNDGAETYRSAAKSPPSWAAALPHDRTEVRRQAAHLTRLYFPGIGATIARRSHCFADWRASHDVPWV